MNSDDLATQVYEEEEETSDAQNPPTSRDETTANTDDIATQAYATTPTKKLDESNSSSAKEEYSPLFTDDVATQAYGDDAGEGRVGASDDVATQSYGEDMPK